MDMTNSLKMQMPLSTSIDNLNQISFWDIEGLKSESQCNLPTNEFHELVENKSRILELGCGTGRVLRALIDDGYTGNLYGADWSRMSLIVAKARLKNVEFYRCDIRKLPYKDQLFDACIHSALLTCITNSKDVTQLLKETNRVLKPSGILYISDFLININISNIIRYTSGLIIFKRFGTFSKGQVFHHYTLHNLQTLLSSTGFQIQGIKISHTKSWHGHKEKGVSIICRKPIINKTM